MLSELSGLRTGLAPRRSSVGSVLALPVADAVAMLVCFAAGRADQLLVRERDRGAGADPGGAGRGLPGDVPPFRPLHAAAAAVAGVRRHCRDRRRWRCCSTWRCSICSRSISRGLWVLTSWALVVPAVPLVRRLVKQVALELGHWLQPTVIVGTGPNAREIAAAYDARNNHLGYQVQAFLDLAAGGGGGQPLRVGGRDIPVLPLDARSQRAAGLARPAARGGGARARRDAGPRGADREPVLLPRRHRRDLALEGAADQQHPGQPLLLARHPVLAHPQQPGAALAAAGQARLRPAGGLGAAAVPRAAAGPGRGARSSWSTAAG